MYVYFAIVLYIVHHVLSVDFYFLCLYLIIAIFSQLTQLNPKRRVLFFNCSSGETRREVTWKSKHTLTGNQCLKTNWTTEMTTWNHFLRLFLSLNNVTRQWE